MKNLRKIIILTVFSFLSFVTVASDSGSAKNPDSSSDWISSSSSERDQGRKLDGLAHRKRFFIRNGNKALIKHMHDKNRVLRLRCQDLQKNLRIELLEKAHKDYQLAQEILAQEIEEIDRNNREHKIAQESAQERAQAALNAHQDRFALNVVGACLYTVCLVSMLNLFRPIRNL